MRRSLNVNINEGDRRRGPVDRLEHGAKTCNAVPV